MLTCISKDAEDRYFEIRWELRENFARPLIMPTTYDKIYELSGPDKDHLLDKLLSGFRYGTEHLAKQWGLSDAQTQKVIADFVARGRMEQVDGGRYRIC